MKLTWQLVIIVTVAIAAIVSLEIVAMGHGIDGVALGAAIALIGALVAGVAGFHLGSGGSTA